MSLKNLLPQRSRRRAGAPDDALAINAETLHQYYSTVQYDIYPQQLLDEALDRRQARALEARRRPLTLRWWVVVLLALTVLAAAAALSG